MRQGLIQGAVISDPTKLLWTPPSLSAPTEQAVPADGSTHVYEPGIEKDVQLVLPGSARTRQTKVAFAKRLQAIGGAFKMGAADSSAFDVRSVAKSVYVEGIDFDMNLQVGTDCFAGSGSANSPWPYQPDIYIQNCLFRNTSANDATSHADGYQPQTGVGNIYVDHCTFGSLELQGLFLQPEGKPRGTLHLSRTNFKYRTTETSTLSSKLLWFFSSLAPTYNVKIGEGVYVEPRAGRTVGQSVEPGEGVKNAAGELIGAYTEDGGATWQFHSPFIEGVVRAGEPPEGDYVTPEDVGLGYISPGYA